MLQNKPVGAIEAALTQTVAASSSCGSNQSLASCRRLVSGGETSGSLRTYAVSCLWLREKGYDVVAACDGSASARRSASKVRRMPSSKPMVGW